MKNKITKLIIEKPKHFSKIIKNNQEMFNWVKENSLIQSDNIAELVYSAIYQTDNICKHGKIKKFNSINNGYQCCGHASYCFCAAELVSTKVKKIKSLLTDESKNKINEKRKQTTLLRYGVINNGQTLLAKRNHQKYYESLPKKEKQKKLTSYQKLNNKYINRSNIKFITPEEEYKGVSNQVYYQFQCLNCNEQFSDYIDNGHAPICKTCNPYNPDYISNQEIEVYNFLKSIYSYEIKQSDKSIINPYELDIVIPQLKLAIEYCGLYWHSEAQKTDQNYHINKANKCSKQGYRLVTIFEDEWTQKTNIVKNRLKSLLGVGEKYHARKCSINIITPKTAIEFIEQHHLQGNAVFKIAYGCFYDNNLVAVMTFGKPRYDKKFDYELIRYCSIGNVIGGASRLFSKFLQDYKPNSVVSYCDMRWGNGNLYKQLGFTNVTQKITPSYSYTDFIRRFHRSKFTKKALVKQGGSIYKTEQQLMKEKKMYKIWDCGQSKWSYTSRVNIIPNR